MTTELLNAWVEDQNLEVRLAPSLLEMAQVSSGAVFSADMKHRYALWRGTPNSRFVMFLMLNPSTANEFKLDPTLKVCNQFTQAFGFDGFTVGNLSAFRSPDPKLLDGENLYQAGLFNDVILRQLASRAEMVICAWGADKWLKSTAGYVLSRRVVDMLSEDGITPHALRLTKEGHPAHPLYLPRDLRPFPMVGVL